MTVAAAAWVPTDGRARASRLWRFMHDLGCTSYPQLCQKAAQNPSWFWDALVKELGIVWSTPYTAVMDTSPGVPLTSWFPGGRLNAYDSAGGPQPPAGPHPPALLRAPQSRDAPATTAAPADGTDVA